MTAHVHSIRSLLTWNLAALIALPVVLSVVADDWPQWRGADRSARTAETGLLQTWPSEGPKLLWKAADLGGGYTTPSVANGKIFGMGYIGDDEVVWALNEADGQPVWRTRTGAAHTQVGYAEGPRCTPTVDGDLLFTLGAGGNLVCLEASTGTIRWQKDLVGEVGGKMMSGWGFSESPLVDGARLVCTPGGSKGTLLALNKETGELLWQTSDITDDAAYSSVVIATIAGVRQYVQLTGASVFGVEPATGKVLWQAERSGRTAVITTPIVADDLVYVTSAYGVGCNAFRVTRNGDTFTATQVYANKIMANHHGGVIYLDGNVYGYSDGKGWTCQNLKTGEVVWAERQALGKGAIGYADKRFYLRAESGDGTVALIEATPEGYRECGRFEQPDRSDKNSWPHPIVANARLYLRDQDVLLCYDLKAN